MKRKNDTILNNLNKIIKIDFKYFNTATSIKNYILNDPIIDWLQYYNITNIYSKPSNIKNKINKSLFENYIIESGNNYENLVLTLIKENYPYVIIGQSYNAQSIKLYNETVDSLLEGIPIIIQGVLHNYNNKTYGCPDIIIKGEYLKKIFNINCLHNNYYIIDIKYTTIKLNANQEYILNTDYTPVYKAQLFIYTQALNNILNTNIDKAFILPKKISWQKKNINTIIDNEYNVINKNINNIKLVTINYKLFDAFIKDNVKNSLLWLNKMKTIGHQWSLLPKPSIKELYPNMKNNRDGYWRNIKQELSEKIKELTSVWHIGIKNRESAFNANVFSYNDERCTTKILNINSQSKIGYIINKILEINRGDIIIKPDKIKFDLIQWRNINNNTLEIYLDYETIDDFIFMIGVGYYKNEWIFKCFICESKSDESQINMYNNFWHYISNELIKNNKTNTLFIHWTNAEPIFYNKQKLKFNLQQKIFLDLYKVFISEPIVIKGALNYSLKTIAKTMYQHKLINTTWDNNNECNNGLNAMIIANNLYNTKNTITHNDMKDIIYYNEIDCLVLCDILKYLRLTH
jgi:hypothetical protein